MPIPINRELTAVEIKLDDPGYLETRTIQIKGSYRFNLFKDNIFKGQIFVPKYPTTAKKMQKLQFIRDVGNEAVMSYVYTTGTDADGHENYEHYNFGKMICKPLLSKMVILVYEQQDNSGWSSKFGYCIVTSAKNREEALNILKKYDISPY
ncbi:hypothetical protein IMX26_00815 [Clostridium sp. 'deep sea']|uniref:hypothetical protein n=1 Tax=Clostridium sp. 'deep sea' TaxID=2779445 RepID=UPI001896518A|nr:hypothetical protein [Clostridium sp. 'deep sea']QOR35417.1 hypothetical protein IMX26_00815 [Clostridium sp. 'deep sea']